MGVETRGGGSFSWRHRTAGWALLATVLLAAFPAAGAEEERLAELVEALRAQGVIDAAQHAEITRRIGAAEEADAGAWHDRFSVWADFRARYEGFFYDRDGFARAAEAMSSELRLQDRHRGRYRARLNLRGEVNARAAVYLRLASGDADPRSTNQTLGDDEDFDTDDFRFDLAYATISPFPGGELPGIQDGHLVLDVGKVKNPFLWKALGEDRLLWDGDITLEGGSLRAAGGSGPLRLHANGGGYVIDENSGSKDPLLLAGQLGAELALAEHVSAGARGTLYHFTSLDDDFFERASESDLTTSRAGGNIADGLARRNGSIQVVEGAVFLAFERWELFPVRLFASYAHNLSARSSRQLPGVSREDDAYGFGVLVGDLERLVRLGAAYYAVEANAFPSMLVDSDVFDGLTNREAYAFSAARRLLPGVVFVFSASISDRIEGGPAFAGSGLGSDRVRLQADLNFEL